jgi:hypothetical protein
MRLIKMTALSRDAKHAIRLRVVMLRAAGATYAAIAVQTGLSRTGVFDICKRHDAGGASALCDAPNGHTAGAGRLLDTGQEAMVCRLIAEHTPEQFAMRALLWSPASVARLIEQQCDIRLLARTTRLYLARWGYGPQPRLRAADEPLPGAFRHWLEGDYAGIVTRARAEGAEIHWGNEGGLHPQEVLPGRSDGCGAVAPVGMHCPRPVVLSTVTNRGQRQWMDFSVAPDADALIDFLGRLTVARTNKLFLIRGNLRIHDSGATAQWLAEHDESIEVFCRPSHGKAGAPGQAGRSRPTA